jgi:hypothetical protein
MKLAATGGCDMVLGCIDTGGGGEDAQAATATNITALNPVFMAHLFLFFRPQPTQENDEKRSGS